MDSLIKISETENGVAVSARELHLFLEVPTDFTLWCKRMFEYDFTEGTDYSLLKIGERSAHNKTDYALTLDTAKEIAMIQRTEKGKQARQYFIEVEKRYQKVRASLSTLDILELSIKGLREQERRLNNVEQSHVALLERVNTVEAKQTKTNEDFYTLAGYYCMGKRRFDLTLAQSIQTGKTLTRKSAELGYIVGKAHSEKYGNVNSYHKFVLQAVLGF